MRSLLLLPILDCCRMQPASAFGMLHLHRLEAHLCKSEHFVPLYNSVQEWQYRQRRENTLVHSRSVNCQHSRPR
jgi:hypothetical protein